jgi:hypothetical protein
MKTKITLSHFNKLNPKLVKELFQETMSSNEFEGITVKVCGYMTYTNPEEHPYLEIKNAVANDADEFELFIAYDANKEQIKDVLNNQKNTAKINYSESRS